MGERAYVIFHDQGRTGYGPVVYLHYEGERIGRHLEAVKARMGDRLDDEQYTTARFIGLAHEAIPGNLSLGVWNLPKDFADEPAYLRDYSPGDAGIFLVNCTTWAVRCFGGYGLVEAVA